MRKWFSAHVPQLIASLFVLSAVTASNLAPQITATPWGI
jgi:hypothetical protein